MSTETLVANVEPRAFDPRQEQQGRLQQAAARLGQRFVEAFNEATTVWLGPGLEVTLEDALVVSAPVAVGTGVAMQHRNLPSGVAFKVVADSQSFYRFYERMLSGTGDAGTGAPRRLGATEFMLGTELGVRWAACVPGLKPLPNVSALILADEIDLPALPASLWPLLRIRLQVAPGGEGNRLEFWVPASLLEGNVPVEMGHAKTDRLGLAPVKIHAILGNVRLRLRELHDLRVGDCVILENGPQDEAVMVLSHQPVYRVRPGRQGRHLAVQILGTLGDGA